jgi:cbb3-type cytochrome oxidase subunit 3
MSALMSQMGLQVWAEVALVIFLAVFAGIAWHALQPKRKTEFDQAASLPLRDDADKTRR